MMVPGIDTGGGGFSGSSAATGGQSASGSNYQGGFFVNHNQKTPWYVYGAGVAALLGYFYFQSKKK